MPSTTSPSPFPRPIPRHGSRRRAAHGRWPAIAAPASAHDELVSTDPAADSTVDALPAQLTLTFSEAIDRRTGASEVQVTDAAGTTLSAVAPAAQDNVLTQPLEGDGIRGHHGAVEGGLERRAPHLGRVLVHRHRAGDPDAHADRDGDARPRRPSETDVATPTPSRCARRG